MRNFTFLRKKKLLLLLFLFFSALVQAQITAVDDSSVTIFVGPSQTVAYNVISNDTFNGVPATSTNTNVTPFTSGP